MSHASVLTRTDLVRAFREIGISPGDSFIVHSSYRSLGPVDGGPEAVIDAMREAIGPKGNLMLPTFNYTRPIPEPYFCPVETPCRTGVIPELGRKRPDALRSIHPTNSVAVIGPDALELTKDHMSYRTIGVGSPVDRLAKMGGKVLLIGVAHTSSSTIHVAEDYMKIPKVSWYPEPLPFCKVRLPDGSFTTHQIDTSPTCSAGFNAVECALRRRGEIRDLPLGGAKLQLMLGEDVIKRACELMAEKTDILLCTWDGCATCTGTRRNLAEEKLPHH